MIMHFERMDDRMLIKSKGQRVLEYSCDLCIIGGGLSGMCAAISAAREGVKVVLIQDRPVLGGNASSEIRMWIRGAKGLHNRETGIVSEIEEENIYRNPTLNYSLWDTVLYEKVKNEKNIRLLLNCTCLDAETVNGSVKSVSAWQLTTYTFYKIKAKYFADCSGDSILAPITGALYRVGREGNSEFNETIGPLTADAKTILTLIRPLKSLTPLFTEAKRGQSRRRRRTSVPVLTHSKRAEQTSGGLSSEESTTAYTIRKCFATSFSR